MKKRKFILSGKTEKILPLIVFFSLLFCFTCYVNGYAVETTNNVLDTQQQRITVKGVVKDAQGETIIGAGIVEKGTSNGTVSDVNGEFSLSVPVNSVLVISFLGYTQQQVTVSGEIVNVTMVEDVQALGEVVITGFGLLQKKATLTGAISSIGSSEISRSITSTASGALVGKIAGINTRQVDGRPGASTSIRIRNMGTPLFVIDGIQSDEGQFNNIDFNDIESISIMKDASASIYGVRASNGVVVVTTKSGQRSTKNTVSVNTYYGWQSMSSFPRAADVTTYLTNYVQSETIQGKQETGNNRYTYSREDLAKWTQGTEKGYIPFDWYDFIIKMTPQAYVNANVSGGSDKINYYLSVGHLTQDAMFVNYGGFSRTNVQINVESQISDRLKIGAKMNGRIESRVNPGVPGGDDYWLPRFGIYRNLPTKRPFANDNPKYPAKTSTEDGTNFGWLTYELSGKYEDTWRVAQLSASAEYNIGSGLKARALTSYYFAYQYLNNQEYTYKLYGYDENTDTYPIVSQNDNPWRERRNKQVEEQTSNIQLAYDKKIDNHTIAAVTGFIAEQRITPESWVHSIPTANSLHLIDYQTMDTYDDYGDRPEARLGWIGRLNYDFANKYLLETSFRYDGSWKFPPNDRWGFFPSASLGWRISEETFWQRSKLSNFFNDLKFRASYGLVGEDDLGDNYSAYDYMAGYNYKEGGSVIDGAYVIGTRPRGLPVTTMSWIQSKIFNAGLDAGFLNQRLTGEANFFRRIRTGLPARRNDVLLPAETGFELPRENLNSDVHMGYDFAVNWKDKIDDFNYSVGMNFTYSRFYDWEQYNPMFSNSWDYYRGSIWHRFGYVNWGYEAIGQFQNWEEIATYPVDIDRQGNKTLRPGDIIFKDVNGDGVINYMDERPIGYREGFTPVMNLGFNFGFEWKGFDLAFDLTGGAYASWFQDWEQRNPFHDGGNNPQYYMSNTWRLTDIWNADSELISGKFPTLLIGNSSHSNYRKSSFWLNNVWYTKLRNFQFGYTIPKTILAKAGLSDMRIYVAGTNLLTFTNIKNVDPESDQNNGLGYPTTRIINIGLNLKF